jgi:hypothetical protein
MFIKTNAHGDLHPRYRLPEPVEYEINVRVDAPSGPVYLSKQGKAPDGEIQQAILEIQMALGRLAA